MGALITFMGFAIVNDYGSEGTDHHTQAAAYTSFLVNSLFRNCFGGAYYLAGRVLTMLTDNRIIFIIYFPYNYPGAAMQLGACFFTIQTAITDIWLN